MPRYLRDVSGVRLIVDRYDLRLWHFAIHGVRYDLHERGGRFLLRTANGAPLGRFADWTEAIAGARRHAGALTATRETPRRTVL